MKNKRSYYLSPFFLASLLASVAFLVFFFGFQSFTVSSGPQRSPDGARVNSHRKPSRIVNLITWPNYLSSDTLQEFEVETGIKVQLSHYSSNEELLAKIQGGAAVYDVALPADYMVSILSKLGLVEELDLTQLPVIHDLQPSFLHRPYDPENRYCLPYSQGATGLAVNRRLYSGEITRWSDLFRTPTLANRFSVLDDMREVIGLALKSLGYSLNSRSPEELEEAKALLLKIKKTMKAFRSDPIMSLVSSEVAVAQIFSTDALQANKIARGGIDFVFPKEGGALWMDNLVIPKGAPHLAEAYELMQFLLQPQVNVFTVMNFFVAPSNAKTLELLSSSFRNNPVIFPAPEVLKNYEMVQDLGDMLPAWEKTWMEIKVY